MNAVALRLLAIVLAVTVLTFVFVRFSKRDRIHRVRENVAWLLKVSFVDFVRLVIFIKPLRSYAEQVAVFLWLILVYIVGQYLIVSQPTISEIDGPYIPMIGYVYFLSALFLIRFVLWIAPPGD